MLDKVLATLLSGWEGATACEIFSEIPDRMDHGNGKDHCDGNCIKCIKIMLDNSV